MIAYRLRLRVPDQKKRTGTVLGAPRPATAAIGNDVKGKISAALYVVAIPSAFLQRWIAFAIYVIVSLTWLAPDRRIEKKVESGVLPHHKSDRPE